MSLPFYARLACIVLASFTTLFALAALATGAWAAAVRRSLEKLPAKTAARCTLFLRLLPASLAILAALLISAPSYWRFEQRQPMEEVGWCLPILALIASALIARSCLRTVRALRRTFQARPTLALIGILRPRVFIPGQIRRALPPQQIELVLRHELAHAASRDNLKRLMILLAPAFPGSLALEAAWRRFAEWAADDAAVNGDSADCLTLAAALVNVARLGIDPRTPPLATPFLLSAQELERRVDRLLNPPAFIQTSWAKLPEWITLLSLAAIYAGASNQAAVHKWLERLIH